MPSHESQIASSPPPNEINSTPDDDDENWMCRPLLDSTTTMNHETYGVFRTPPPPLPWYRNYPQISAMLSNFSTSYNAVNISLVLPIWNILAQQDDAQEEAWVASSLLAGMIMGQVGGGLLGDVLGATVALRVVMILQIVASIASSTLLTTGSWSTLALWRLILGVGAGGVYPLAAVLSAGGVGEKSLERVVLTFSMQGVGFIAVPSVTMLLLALGLPLEFVWRFLLGFGCVPGLVLVYVQWLARQKGQLSATHRAVSQLDEVDIAFTEEQQDQEDSSVSDVENESVLDSVPEFNTEGREDDRPGNSQDNGVGASGARQVGVWEAVRHENDIVKKLLGTAATWFLFDVLFYGNTLFQPIVIEAAFGSRDHSDPRKLLQRTTEDSFLLTSIALPGYFAALLFLGKSNRLCYCSLEQTPRFVMLQGFCAMAVLYLLIGSAWNRLRQFPSILLLLYGLTFFFANYGPNTTTFVLPSLVYSVECRSTLNGLCAAAGKLGALCGASLFQPAADWLGDAHVMMLCAGISLLALLLTQWCVPRSPTSSMTTGIILQEDDSTSGNNDDESL